MLGHLEIVVQTTNTLKISDSKPILRQLCTDVDYALVNRPRGPYEEIFVLTFKAYGPTQTK